MKRLIAKKPYRSGTTDYMKAWARNIKTNTVVEVDLLNQYDDHRTEVGYMDSKFIVENSDLYTVEQYQEYIDYAVNIGMTKEEAEISMSAGVSLEELRSK